MYVSIRNFFSNQNDLRDHNGVTEKSSLFKNCLVELKYIYSQSFFCCFFIFICSIYYLIFFFYPKLNE